MKKYNRTDAGNAERLVDRYERQIRYCKEIKRWLVFDVDEWSFDEDKIVRWAMQTIRDVAWYEQSEAQRLGREYNYELLDHCKRSESLPRIQAMLKLAQSLEGVAVSLGDLWIEVGGA